MALGWLTVLKAVPWNEVIGNAPVVADGAKKLWSAVAKRQAAEPMPAAEAAAPVAPGDASAVAVLQSRISALEATTIEFHQQMLASSELIKALAEQNAQLIQRIEANRVRTLWLAVATTVTAIAAVGSLVMLWMRAAA